MWVEGPTQLDTPVLVFGFEVEDLAAMMGVMLLSSLLFEGMAGVCVVTVSAGLLVKRLEARAPAGGADSPGAPAGTDPHSRRRQAQGAALFAERSGRLRVISVFGQGDVRILRLETATAILALGCLVLGLLLGWQATRGLPVCYGAASVAPGLVVPGEVPEAHVRALSEQVVLVLYNITPATAQAAHERVAPLLHPNLLRTFSVRRNWSAS